MATTRRKPPSSRKRPPPHRDMIAWVVVSLAALIFTLCLCVFNFEMTGVVSSSGEAKTANTAPRLEKCRTTCDDRLQTAALESSMPSSLSPSVMDSLFLRRDVVIVDNNNSQHQRSSNSANNHQNNNSHSNNYYNSNPLSRHAQVRPRRLPTLIKILTGFTDDPNWYHGQSSTSSNNNNNGNNGQKPIIARIEKPFFSQPSSQPTSSSSSSSSRQRKNNNALNEEQTVQMAATAAATALWSKSIRTFGNNRMRRINAEWDAALRWIAGWGDSHQQVLMGAGSFALLNEEWGGASAGSAGGGSSGSGAANGASVGQANNNAHGFHEFVDDLTRLLQTCIVQCLQDEHFDFGTNMEANKHSDGVAVDDGKSLDGNILLRSMRSWFMGSTFPRISLGKLDRISKHSQFFLTGAARLVISSIAVYAMRSIWSWVSPALCDWYTSLRYTETPEWLIEHEKEIELAKNVQGKQKKVGSSKKGKKKSGNKLQTGNKHKNGANPSTSDSVQMRIPKESEVTTTHASTTSDNYGTSSHRISDSSELEDNDEEWLHARPSKKSQSSVENISVVANDPAARKQTPKEHEEAPSTSSLSSVSTSISSPTFKPISSHSAEQNVPDTEPLNGTSKSLLGWSSPLDIRSGTSLSQLPLQLRNQTASLPVPTQEQRNEAAKKLREFQQAQIQRILYQKKLAEALKPNPVPIVNDVANAPNGSGLLLGTPLLTPDKLLSDNTIHAPAPTLKPPPGLTHPSEIQYTAHNASHHEDDSFLSDNDLLLSKLLDDDDDDQHDVANVASSLRSEIESMSNEMSLDPSAAPFVSERVGKHDEEPHPQSKDPIDTWQASGAKLVGSIERPFSDSGGLKIKGVYGGNVW